MARTTEQMLAQQKRFEEAHRVVRYSGYSTIIEEPSTAEIISAAIREQQGRADANRFIPDASGLLQRLKERANG